MFFSDYHHNCSRLSPVILVRKKIKMSVLVVLIIASIIVALGFLIAFIWSVKNGQYDDDYTPSVRMLFDSTVTPSAKESTTKLSQTEQLTKNN